MDAAGAPVRTAIRSARQASPITNVDLLIARLEAEDAADGDLLADLRALAASDEPRRTEPLVRALTFHLPDIEDDDNLGLDVRRMAACALGRSRDPRAVPALVDALLEHDEDEIGRAAAWALGALGDRSAAPALQEAIWRQDGGGRWEQAAYALARLDDPQLDVVLDDLRAWRLKVAPGLSPQESGPEIRERRLWENEFTGCAERPG